MVRYLGTDSRHDSTLCERDIKFLNESSNVGAGSFSILAVSPPVNLRGGSLMNFPSHFTEEESEVERGQMIPQHLSK